MHLQPLGEEIMENVTLSWRDVLPPVKAILANYWTSSRRILVLVSLIVFLSAAASIAAPYVFSRLIDEMGATNIVETLMAGFVAYAFLLGISASLGLAVQYLSYMTAANLSFITGTRLFGEILRKRADFFVEHNPAEIQNAGAQAQNALMTLVQLGLIVLIPGVTQIILTLTTLSATINLTIAAVTVIYGTGYIALNVIANRQTRPYLDAAITAAQENARFVGNAMNAMETLRHFGSDQWMLSRFSTQAGEVRDNWRSFCLRRLSYCAIFGIGLAIQFGFTFYLLMPRYRAGFVSVGDIVLFNALLLQLNQPFQMIGHAIEDIGRARASLSPLAKIWAAPAETDRADQNKLTVAKGQLSFKNVSYAYENQRGVSDVSFVAERGHITFLAGETGSGKSTLFKLALKTLDPHAGTIKVDDVDLQKISRADWYGHIGVVPQDIALLNESLASNIVLGRSFDTKRLRLAAAKAAILDFIDALPDGFDTSVGERGLKLSGGERQRIAIARALYSNPDFLFLDEASSALDDATERDIMDHIRTLTNDVTVVAITHRRSIIASGDRVVVLSSGRMID
jgi:ABC-type multidrug transport system fused ATPase/permease subunit